MRAKSGGKAYGEAGVLGARVVWEEDAAGGQRSAGRYGGGALGRLLRRWDSGIFME